MANGINGFDSDKPYTISDAGSDVTESISVPPGLPFGTLKQRKSIREPADGSLVLGKGTDTSYVTRYKIVREKQRELIQEDMELDLVPFCFASQRKSCLGTVWLFVKSEPFLLTMHLTALVFSVLKRTIRDVEIDANLELVHACLETFVAVMSLVIRIASGHEKFHEEKVVRKEIEHLPDSGRTHTLKRMMKIFYIVGVLLILLLLTSLGLLIAFDKLHWTIVTTNFALIVGGIGGNLVMQRLQGMVSKIIEDQHKAIIYESMLLLKDCVDQPRSVALTERIKKFCKSVENTELLKNHGHIDKDPDNQFIDSNWNVPALLVLQTSV